MVEGVRMKALGVSAGFPDVFVVLACGKYHGFFVEMKPEKGGKVTDSQLEWLAHLRSKGYYAEVAKGFEDAKRQFMDYLRLGDYA